MAGEIAETVAAVQDLADDAAFAQSADAIIAEVVERAEERVESAERAAAQIADAAMESARGERLASLEGKIETWQNDQAELRAMLTDLSSQVATLAGQISATATLVVATEPELTASSLSTPPNSEVDQAIAEVQEILPESLSESAVAAPPVVPEPKKRARWI